AQHHRHPRSCSQLSRILARTNLNIALSKVLDKLFEFSRMTRFGLWRTLRAETSTTPPSS
ncbi:hypothetical protein, partial [Vibrio breoganii]|uniref:hypothetical protein n=1 Tax=Vibrio breoganii TaxID=553239 RepID=UPI001A7E0877